MDTGMTMFPHLEPLPILEQMSILEMAWILILEFLLHQNQGFISFSFKHWQLMVKKVSLTLSTMGKLCPAVIEPNER